MCVIIHAKPKQTVEKAVLESCYNRNADGWGIMWAEGGKINTVKDVSDFDTFYNTWIKDVPRHAERGIHFRIRTHGGKNQPNCHPFKPTEDVALMHNGMINSMPLIEREMSDTYNFCKYEVAPLIKGWNNFMQDEDFIKLLEMHEVTGSSKLLFIDKMGNSLRINDKMWHKHEGVYFSNNYSIPYKHSVVIHKYDSTTGSYVTTSRAANYTPHVNNKTFGVSSGALSSAYDPYDCDDAGYDADGWPKEQAKSVLDLAAFRNIKGAITEATTMLGGSPLVKSAERIVSDLYAGNKTEEEGEAYIAAMEAEDAEQLRIYEEELQEALSGGTAEVVDPFPKEVVSGEVPEDEEEEDDEDNYELDLDTIMGMTFQELYEDMEAFPKAYALAFRGLIDTCSSAGIFKTTVNSETGIVLNSREAVNT